MAVIVMRAHFSPAAKLVTYTGIEKQLDWLPLYGMRADGSTLMSPIHPFEAAGTPLHSCRYI